MSAISVTCRRTLSRARSLFATVLAVPGFAAASAALFAFRLEAAEGTRQTIAIVWATSAAPFLPVLAAFLAMDVWSDERRTGRMSLLLSTAVRERDFVLGKALGVWLVSAAATALSLVFALGSLAFFAPSALADVRLVAFGPAMFALLMQSSLWCAASVAFSAMFSRAFAAACASVTALAILPRCLWAAAMLWSSSGRPAFGEMPLDAQVADFAAGVVSTGAVVTFAALTAMSLFIAAKCVALTRFSGRRSGKWRFSTAVAMALSVALAVSVSVLAFRLDETLDLPVGNVVTFSQRMRHILSESSGRVSVTAFLPRNAPLFKPVSHFLRTLKRQADSAGGLTMSLYFVDPKWDLGAAERLVRLGAKENSVVFEKGHRSVVLPLDDGFGDRPVASAIQRVAMPPRRRDVYWTTGHGEAAFDSYGTWGLSDIARELARSGYRNMTLDLSADKAIPSDCALIVIAGAKESFSRAELGRIDAYLKGGGRLLVMMGQPGETGVSSILPSWGIRPVVQPLVGARTLSGSDVIVSDFADHPIASQLAGSRIVLEKPLSFASSAVAESGSGADRLEFSQVARVGQSAVAAAVERGGTAGSDLAVRPTRIVAIGDPSFVLNGQLASRANANRDFFLNAVAYLSGADTFGSSGLEVDALSTGMDRDARVRFAIVTVAGLPGVVFLLLTAVAMRRRRRG